MLIPLGASHSAPLIASTPHNNRCLLLRRDVRAVDHPAGGDGRHGAVGAIGSPSAIIGPPKGSSRNPRQCPVARSDGGSQLSRRVSSDMALTVSNSCTTLRLASTFSGASPDSGTSLRYFASTSAHSIPRGPDPRGKST